MFGVEQSWLYQRWTFFFWPLVITISCFYDNSWFIDLDTETFKKGSKQWEGCNSITTFSYDVSFEHILWLTLTHFPSKIKPRCIKLELYASHFLIGIDLRGKVNILYLGPLVITYMKGLTHVTPDA